MRMGMVRMTHAQCGHATHFPRLASMRSKVQTVLAGNTLRRQANQESAQIEAVAMHQLV
jgi:hypothetical protein